MGKGVEKVRDFMKKEAVLCIALGLAILSVLWQPVDKNYLGSVSYTHLDIIIICRWSVSEMQYLLSLD